MKLGIQSNGFTKASDIEIPEIFYKRLKTGIKEFDDMFGEGLLPGSSITFTGVAGSGKTTVLLQLMEALAGNGYKVGYASGEENIHQLAFTCRRLNVKNVSIANETDIDNLAKAMVDYDVIVVDSFQALTSRKKLNSSELEKYAVSTLVSNAKKHECVLIFVMHLTKAGVLKGSTLVPHSVDVNLKLEIDKDGEDTARILDVYKNRFGRTGAYNALLTSTGIEVSGKREVERSASKADRNKKLEDAIMKLDPPNITKKHIMSEFSLTPSQAYIILKQMTDKGLLVKMGRGDNAVWKKKQITAKA